MKRKRRPGEVVCRCGAYRFPHRMMGGACDGGALVERTFEAQVWGDCRDCVHVEIDEETTERRCQVLEGREALLNCPALADTIRYEGVKLYGVNRPPERAGALRRR